MSKKLSLLCKYYAAGELDQQHYRQQRAEVISELLSQATHPSQHSSQLEDTTLKDYKHADVAAPMVAGIAPPIKPTYNSLDDLHAPVKNYTDLNRGSGGLTNQSTFKSLFLGSEHIYTVAFIFCLVTVIGAGTYFFIRSNANPTAPPLSIQAPEKGVLWTRYNILMEQPDWWTEQEIKAFLHAWDNASKIQRQQLRHDKQFGQLMSDILAYEASSDQLNEKITLLLDALRMRLLTN